MLTHRASIRAASPVSWADFEFGAKPNRLIRVALCDERCFVLTGHSSSSIDFPGGPETSATLHGSDMPHSWNREDVAAASVLKMQGNVGEGLRATVHNQHYQV